MWKKYYLTIRKKLFTKITLWRIVNFIKEIGIYSKVWVAEQYIYIYICVCVCVYIYICVCVCVYIYIYIYIYMCVCVCIYIYIYIYIHTHTLSKYARNSFQNFVLNSQIWVGGKPDFKRHLFCQVIPAQDMLQSHVPATMSRYGSK